MNKHDTFESISTTELWHVGGGHALRHELWQLNNALTTNVQQQQSSSSQGNDTMMAMCMAAMVARR